MQKTSVPIEYFDNFSKNAKLRQRQITSIKNFGRDGTRARTLGVPNDTWLMSLTTSPNNP